MPKACAEAALSLLSCMEESKCVTESTTGGVDSDGNTINPKSVYDCLKQQNDDPVAAEECKAQRNAYYLCKHSQLNMRTRIRGTRAY
mmetsp:Transcript_45312/g.50448  ORF Transcript_45312/g.50448 Transcript_45312/m.50448 type:complete len:87 (+) Transcript_45312:210-470(+)